MTGLRMGALQNRAAHPCRGKGSSVATFRFGCRDYKTAVDGGRELPSQNQSPENSRESDAIETVEPGRVSRSDQREGRGEQ